MLSNGEAAGMERMDDLSILRREEQEGSAKAAYELGVKLATGICGEIDQDEAISYLKKVSGLDSTGKDREYVGKARRYLGHLYFENNDIPNAISYYQWALQCESLSEEEVDEIRAKLREANKKLDMRRARTPVHQKEQETQKPETSQPRQSNSEPVVEQRPPIKPEKHSYGKIALVALLILGLIIAIVCCSVQSQDADYDSSEADYDTSEENWEAWMDYPEDFIFPNSSSEYLDDWDVEELNLDDTQWAINEIYARHGVDFHDEPYKSYFDSCYWHESIYRVKDFDSSWFNEYEQYNIDLLAEHRSELQ